MNWLKQLWLNPPAWAQKLPKWAWGLVVLGVGAAVYFVLLPAGVKPPDELPDIFQAPGPDGAVYATGWVDDAEQVQAVAATLEFPTFADTEAGKVRNDALPKAAYLWDAERKLTGKVPPPQNQGQVGSCVSFGTARAIERTMAVQIALKGNGEELHRLAEEVIYAGARVEVGGGRIRGDGAVGAWAAAYVQPGKGGVAERGVHGRYDLSVYSESRCREWGRSGVPDDLEPAVKEHPVRDVSRVENWAQAKKSLASGYGIAVCSDVGFQGMKRDNRGVLQPSGTWNHCMLLDGYHTEPDGSEYGHLENSWGCYDEETEVLTERGWARFGDLCGERLATLNPNTHAIEYHAPTHYHVYPYDGELWHYKARDIDLMVTPNHRMYLHKINNKNSDNPAEWDVIEAQHCPGHFRIKKDGAWEGVEASHHVVGGVAVPMDDWMEFLGYFVSEGWTAAHTSTFVRKWTTRRGEPREGVMTRQPYLVGIAQNDGEKADKMAALLDRLPWHFGRRQDRSWVCHNKALWEELRELGKAKEKRLPDYALRLSPRQLRILVDAMFLGDGTRSWGKEVYYTSSKALADQVQELALKVGQCADISALDRVGRDNGSGVTRGIEYRVGFKRSETCPCPHGGWRPERVAYVGNVYCVTVPNHLVYVRRNGRACWCGNSNAHKGPVGWGDPSTAGFWTPSSVVDRMLRQGDSWAFADAKGFPAKKIDWFVQRPAPRDIRPDVFARLFAQEVFRR